MTDCLRLYRMQVDAALSCMALAALGWNSEKFQYCKLDAAN